MEKNSVLKNTWILSGILMGTSMLICYVGVAIIGRSIYYSVGIISIMIVGHIYAVKFKEGMPKDKRIKIIFIYSGIQMIILLIFLFTQEIDRRIISMILLTTSCFMIVQAILMNSTLRFIGKMAIKKYSGK